MFIYLLLVTGQITPMAAKTLPPEAPKMICKTFDEIGSRVRKRKVCRTRTDWDLQARNQRTQSEQLRDSPEVNPIRN